MWQLAAAGLVALGTLASTANAAGPTLKSPSAAEISRGPARIPDGTVVSSGVRRLQTAGGYWGGTYTAYTGETLTIDVSTRYPQDDARAQRWADFLAGLVHGSELSSLTAYLAPLDEVQSICGQEALACYSDREDLLVTPGDDPASDVSAEAVITHEYGHHVAAHRQNDPWAAIDYGTKRWSSYEQVCRRTTAGELHPGAESSVDYQTNPGEAFAESYRVLNERKSGLTEVPWEVVSQSLYPDATALGLLERDVRTPWTQDTTSTRGSSFARRGASVRSFALATPLDGSFAVTVRLPRTLKAAADLYAGNVRVAHAASSGGAPTLRATVCGTRALRLVVTRKSGSGAFRVAAATP